MTRWWVVLLVALLAGSVFAGPGVCAQSGSLLVDAIVTPQAGGGRLGLGADVGLSLGDVLLRADTLAVLPGEWAWQGFSAAYEFAEVELGTSVLFDNWRFCYGEVSFFGSAGNVFAEVRYARLGATSLGEPCGGAALRVSFPFATASLTSVTEFGAEMLRADGSGITFVQRETERAKYFAMDPRPSGGWITRETIIATLPILSDFIGDLAVRSSISFAGGGFERLTMGIGDLGSNPDVLPIDVKNDLVLRVQSGSLVIAPGQETFIGVTLGDMRIGAGAYGAGGFSLGGLTGELTFGPVSLAYTWLRGSGPLVIASRAYANRVLMEADALADGIDFNPEYRQALAFAYGSKVRGGSGDLGVLAVVFYDTASSGILGCAAADLEASYEYDRDLSFSARAALDRLGVRLLRLGVEARF
jgi:hypothetical protein